VLMGFGLSAAGEITRRRAFVSIVWVLMLYFALTNLACSPPPEGPPQGMPPR
jgi:hypothetical protein